MELPELPDELWVLIFRKYLAGNDTIRFRQVSKRFKFLIEQFCMSELLVFDHFGPAFERHTEDKNPDLWVHVSEFKPNSSFQAMFFRLKFLQVDMYLSNNFNVEFFNEFISLEKLYLNTVIISTNQSLRLPKLKVLSISLFTMRQVTDRGNVPERVDYSREPRLTLSSKVETLFCSSNRFDVLKLEHPGCIEVLDCRRGVNEQMLALLKNLRVLRMNKLVLAKLSKPEFIDAFEKLEQLEELHLDVSLCEGDDRLIGELISKLMSLRRTLKLTFLGIPFPFPFPLEGPITGRKSRFHEWNFRFANYHKLSHVRCPQITYDHLIRSLDQQRDRLSSNGVALNEKGFPVCFFEKHLNIIQVNVRQTIDEERFLWFLSQCTRLRTLGMQTKHLSETLLSGLPMSCGQLKYLEIYGADSKVPQMDLSPICKLSSLIRLLIRAQISDCPFDLAHLFEQCKHLVDVELGYISVRKKTLYEVSFRNVASLTNETYGSSIRLTYTNETYGPIRLTYTREQLLANVNKHAQEGKEYDLLIQKRQAEAKKCRW